MAYLHKNEATEAATSSLELMAAFLTDKWQFF